jgi:hypothetical protein
MTTEGTSAVAESNRAVLRVRAKMDAKDSGMNIFAPGLPPMFLLVRVSTTRARIQDFVALHQRVCV